MAGFESPPPDTVAVFTTLEAASVATTIQIKSRVLDERGKLLSQYWHSGNLIYLKTVDVAGKIWVAAGGVNNARKMATLILLDPDRIEGASHEDAAKYQLRGFPPANERMRVFFPRACINLRYRPFNFVTDILDGGKEFVAVVDNGDLYPQRGATVFYHFGPDFSMNHMTVSSQFENEHAVLYRSHVLDHELSEREVAELQRIVTGTDQPIGHRAGL